MQAFFHFRVNSSSTSKNTILENTLENQPLPILKRPNFHRLKKVNSYNQ